MHTEPRGQGSLPWRLRLTALLGRANSRACTSVANCATAALPRRLHGAGKSGQPVRERRNHKLTMGAETKNAGLAWREAPEPN